MLINKYMSCLPDAAAEVLQAVLAHDEPGVLRRDLTYHIVLNIVCYIIVCHITV